MYILLKLQAIVSYVPDTMEFELGDSGLAISLLFFKLIILEYLRYKAQILCHCCFFVVAFYPKQKKLEAPYPQVVSQNMAKISLSRFSGYCSKSNLTIRTRKVS